MLLQTLKDIVILLWMTALWSLMAHQCCLEIFSHIKYIYETEEEREDLHKKVRCCANEYVRYIHEHRPDLQHASLIDAMEAFGIEWEGVPHSSVADTFACRKVWNTLFPNYYAE